MALPARCGIDELRGDHLKIPRHLSAVGGFP
jgi:hypothetical protein